MALSLNGFISDARLGFRLLILLPLKKLGQPPGAERFAENFFSEGLVPTTLAERAALAAASRCLGCGLCDAAPGPGPQPSLLPTTLSKSSTELAAIGADLAAYAANPERLAEAERLCPTRVPLQQLGAFLQARRAGLLAGNAAAESA